MSVSVAWQWLSQSYIPQVEMGNCVGSWQLVALSQEMWRGFALGVSLCALSGLHVLLCCLTGPRRIRESQDPDCPGLSPSSAIYYPVCDLGKIT